MVVGSSAEIDILQSTGQGNFIFTEGQRPIPLAVAPDASAEQRAQAFIAQYGTVFGLNEASQVKVTTVSDKDEVGMEHVRLQQMHKGVSVTAGEMTVHLQGSNVVLVLAKTLPGLESQSVTAQVKTPPAKPEVF